MFVEDAFQRFRQRRNSKFGTNRNRIPSSDESQIEYNEIDPSAYYEFPAPIVPKIFYFMLFYCFGGYRPYVPLFLKSIGFSDSLVGITLFFPPSVSFIAGPLWSGICDRFKCHRRAVVWCSITSAFLILLLYVIDSHSLVIIIVIVNSVVWSPLTPIIDSTTYKVLGSNSFLYGKQRMFGSLGFAVSATLVGYLAQLLHRPVYWINYPIMLFAYGLMVEWMYYDHPLTANRSNFTKLEEISNTEVEEIDEKLKQQNTQIGRDEVERPIIIDTTDNGNDTSAIVDDTEEIEIEDLPTDADKSKADLPAKPMSFGSSLYILLSNYRLLCFLLNALIVGTGMAMNNNFLGIIITEHLKGTTTLVGIGSVLNIVFELVFFFFGKQILDKLGVVRMIIVSHIALCIRVLAYITIISAELNAWFILPVELLHGIIFASIWSAGSRICSDLAPKGLEATSQSLLYSVYLGLGMGIGALMGGRILESSGPSAMYFCILAMTVFGLILFIIFQFMERYIESKKKHQSLSDALNKVSEFDDDRASESIGDKQSISSPLVSSGDDSPSFTPPNELETTTQSNPSMILRASFE